MKIDVSLGELVDRVAILSIKAERIEDKEKLKHIVPYYELLKGSMEQAGITEDSEDFKELRAINSHLWDIENAIRLKEEKKEFDDAFIQLARSVYLRNDARTAVKRRIDLKFGSALLEEKEYSVYGT